LKFLNRSNAIESKLSVMLEFFRWQSARRSSALEIEKPRRIAAEHRILLTRTQEWAVLANIVDALPIGAEAFEVRHVGAPHQFGGAEQIAHVADEFLRFGVWVLPDAAPRDG